MATEREKPSTRPLWYLTKKRTPVRAGKGAPADAIAFAHEGDAEWTPIESERLGDGSVAGAAGAEDRTS